MTIRDTSFWLNEVELKTPIHDEMVLWTFNNAETISKDFNLLPEITKRFDSYSEVDGRWDWSTEKFIPESVKWSTERFISESVKFCEEAQSDFNSFNSQEDYFLTKTIEYPIKCNGFNLGYIDLLLIFSINKGSRYFTRYFKKGVSGIYTVAFEIKPEVKSIGEVLRQFQYYKSNMSGECKFVLVTKTKGLKEIFESQGFFVKEYSEAHQ